VIEVLLVWIFRVVVVMMIARFVMGLFGGRRRTAAGPSWPGAGPASTGRSERSGGTLVRDPQCGTYLPESRAIRAGGGAHVVYFCSVTCRDAYSASESSVAS
jgi:hypothetical protein